MSNSDPNLPLWLAILSLSEQATRDWLTGLYNRRYFEETLSDHVESAKRYGRELSLILFDINDFKRINDHHGHEAGDAVLKEFATLLKTTARAADIICRFGGDEFAVILPETGKEDAEHVLKRIQAQQKSPTVTAGIAALPAENILSDADSDLIKKKQVNAAPRIDRQP